MIDSPSIDEWELLFELAAALAELVEATSKAEQLGQVLMAGGVVQLDQAATLGAEIVELRREARCTLARFHQWAEQPT